MKAVDDVLISIRYSAYVAAAAWLAAAA